MGDFNLEHRFPMPKDDARARLQALGEYLHNKHGLSVSWSGDMAGPTSAAARVALSRTAEIMFAQKRAAEGSRAMYRSTNG